eukprot:TRINITY_DN37679_c0_g2_i4.p1 TRINITY_DN37679_c0_g2~~TRINITY_DN37679_c0_g2_i4.p1  ORF type:complete len:213 (+),score=34.86 TRINITY_DN37679_c0_g2_i4:131-769(+)
MVSLGVTTANFGPEFKLVNGAHGPLPGPPAPHFPGISGTRFNQMQALTIYREVLKKEDGLRSTHPSKAQSVIQAQKEMDLHEASLRPSQRPPPGRVLDIMPGYANVKRQYYRTGFTFDAAGNAVSREDLPPTPPVSATSSRAGSGAKDAISSKTPSVRPSMLRSNSLPSGSHAATAAAGFSRSPHVPGGAIEEDFKLLIKKTCSRSKDLYFC